MKLKKLMIAVLAIGVAVYGGILIKKAFFEKGYANKEDAKETLLSYYVISLGLPDTKANKKVFPKHNNKKKNIGFPLARIVAIMSLTTGSVIDYAMDACKGKGTGEISLLRRIFGCIEENDILICDRLYCNFF